MDMIETAPLSVLIPTRDEERNIEACLASVAFAGECVVFDSGSIDTTREVAATRGARVVERAFDVFSRHKNWALDNIDFGHDWVLILDADERVPPALAEEIRRVLAAPTADGYYVARQNLFQGKWIRHAGMYPDWQLRLFRRGRARYENRCVHEHMVVDGQTAFLEHHLVHHDYKGIERYFERHNHYTSLEAIEVHRMLRRSRDDVIAGRLNDRGPARRRALKNFAYRHLPARALVVFAYMYGWKRGFLDGRTGLRYCLIRAFHEYQISLKLKELRDPTSPMAVKYRDLLAQ